MHGLALVFWATARVGVHGLSLRLPYLGVFPFTLLHLPLDFIRVSSLRPTYLHPFGRPITYSRLGNFPGLGLALWYPMLWSQRPRAEVCMKQKSRFRFLPWPGFEPRTLHFNDREHYHLTTMQPLCLIVKMFDYNYKKLQLRNYYCLFLFRFYGLLFSFFSLISFLLLLFHFHPPNCRPIW